MIQVVLACADAEKIGLLLYGVPVRHKLWFDQLALDENVDDCRIILRAIKLSSNGYR